MAELWRQADVSVVIPCFNAATTLMRALQSVEAQTYPIGEVIIVDDGSSDVATVRALVDSRAWRSPVRLIELGRNAGVSAARNHGIAAAQGDFIALLDADDIWHPRKTEIQLAALTRTSMDFASGRMLSCMQAPEHLASIQLTNRRSRLIGLTELLMRNPVLTSTVIMRRTKAPRFNEQLRRAEDWVVWVEMAATSGGCLHLDEYLAGAFKRLVGEAGLSADMLALSGAHLRGVRYLHMKGVLGSGQAAVACAAEILKLPPRLLVKGLLPRIVGSRLQDKRAR